MTLYFRKQFIVYLYDAFWCSTYQNFTVSIFHLAHVILVYFAVVGTTENFQAQSIVDFVLVDAFWEKVDHDVGFTHVYEHIVFEYDAAGDFSSIRHSYGVHFLEDTEADAQIFDVVALLVRVVAPSLRLRIKENLKVLAPMLLSCLLIP